MLRTMSSALMRRTLFPPVAPDAKKNAVRDLLLFFRRKFPQVLEKEKQKPVMLLLGQLLERLSEEEIKILIEHSATADIFLNIKEKIINVLHTAAILNEVRILFTNDASILYSNKNYFQCFVELLDLLNKINLLKTENLSLFFSSNAALTHFTDVKEALILMQERKLGASQTHLSTVLNFPQKTKLITFLLREREENDGLRAIFSEEEFCGLINSYFQDHKQDIMAYGFKCYLNEYQKNKIQENAKTWFCSQPSLSVPQEQDAVFSYKM